MNDTFTWQNYLQSSEEFQEEILKDLRERLSHETAKQQAAEFEGAPGIVILEFLPTLEYDVQVMIWKEHLPVADRPYALGALKEQAKVKLGLMPKKKLSKYHFIS